MTWSIRSGGAADAAACHDIYFDAVRNGTAPHYSAEQAWAWAPSREVEPWLVPRLAEGVTWLAETEVEQTGFDGIVPRAEGFLTVTRDGHLDLFFVRPAWRGTGLSAALYDRMTGWAVDNDVTQMTTFASHLARRFLERRGWSVIEGETNLRHGVALDRWKMTGRVV